MSKEGKKKIYEIDPGNSDHIRIDEGDITVYKVTKQEKDGFFKKALVSQHYLKNNGVKNPTDSWLMGSSRLRDLTTSYIHSIINIDSQNSGYMIDYTSGTVMTEDQYDELHELQKLRGPFVNSSSEWAKILRRERERFEEYSYEFLLNYFSLSPDFEFYDEFKNPEDVTADIEKLFMKYIEERSKGSPHIEITRRQNSYTLQIKVGNKTIYLENEIGKSDVYTEILDDKALIFAGSRDWKDEVVEYHTETLIDYIKSNNLIQEIENGFIHNNKYYPSMDELEEALKSFVRENSKENWRW